MGDVGLLTQNELTGYPNDGTTYYWWVWAINAAGWCSQSEVIANGGCSVINEP